MGTDPKYQVILYSDGACSPNPGKGGWAALLSCPTSSIVRRVYGYVPDTTNNRMELMAIIEGLSAVKEPQNTSVVIYTDSVWASHAANPDDSWEIKKNLDLVETARSLVREFHSYEFKWVKGHSNVPGNEECNTMAIKAIALQIERYSELVT